MTRKLTYLIVEDDAVCVRIVELELSAHGYQVSYDHVKNKNDMRQKLCGKHYDFIIADHYMPSFSALDALAVRNELALSVPFIILSIGLSDTVREEAFSQGCSRIISKDSISFLADILRELV